MKVAVYAISKNEEQFVERFMESVKDADLIAIADTGSTDNTYNKFIEVAEKLGIQDKLKIQTIHICPWRFDDARNANLAMVPADYDVCMCIDIDEVLMPGWCKALQQCFEAGFTRLRYHYTWSWAEDGSPGITYWADKIHVREGYRWHMPCHEILVKDPRTGEEIQTYSQGEGGLKIEHHADNTKSRSSYLPLLKLAVMENPNNDREAHYYARELMNHGYFRSAIVEFEKHLAMPSATWKEERAASLRYMGRCYWAVGEFDKAVEYHLKATEEAPNTREPWMELAQAYRALKRWKECKETCERCLSITDKNLTYITMPEAWSGWTEQMLQEANTHLLEVKTS